MDLSDLPYGRAARIDGNDDNTRPTSRIVKLCKKPESISRSISSRNEAYSLRLLRNQNNDTLREKRRSRWIEIEFQSAYDLWLDERHFRYHCPIGYCDLHKGPNRLTSTQLIAHLQKQHNEVMINNVLKDTERMLRILMRAKQAKDLADKRHIQ